MTGSGVAQVAYTLDPNGTGTFTSTNTSMMLEADQKNISSYASDMNFTHKASRRIFFVDNSGNAFYVPVLMKFSDWVSTHAVVSYEGLMGISGMTSFIPGNTKKHIRDMVAYLIDLHKEKKCTIGFTIDNLVISKGGVVAFTRVKHIDQSTRHGNVGPDNDFSCLGSVLTNMFGQQQIPYDMSHLIAILGNSRGRHELIKFHCAILTAEKRRTLLQKFWNPREIATNKYYKAALNLVGLTSWIGNVPMTGPLRRVYNHDNADGKKYKNTSQSHYHYLRNVESHLTQSGGCKEAEVEKFITIAFPESIPRLQEELHKKKILWDFMPKNW